MLCKRLTGRLLSLETIKAIAHRHNLTASFLPKIFPDTAGSGCHIHFSLWHDEKNLLGDPQGICGLSPIALQFIAGIPPSSGTDGTNDSKY
ncbi:hypothetical protein NUACC26_095640 [Scytonema sp. NUACC26]